MKKKPADLSQVYCIGDQDEAQRRHGELPKELKRHMWRIFAHKAGLCPNPGFMSARRPRSTMIDATKTPLALPCPLSLMNGLTPRQVAEELVRRGFVKWAPPRHRGLEIVGTHVPAEDE
jgi:hypothetical protein